MDETVAPNPIDTTLHRLERLAAIADALGAARLAREAESLVARAVEGRFYVGVVGEFKRGKSTLINALAGETVLPSGIVPVTSVTTFVRYGESLAARVRTGGKDWQPIGIADVCAYVSEEHNPENVNAIDAVEVFVPCPLLASGVCLVDTPGIGSIFRGNTDTTSAFIPRIDVCLLVTGAEPPLSGDELDLARAVAKNGTPVIVVLNKADRSSSDERSAAKTFAAHALGTQLPDSFSGVLEVSAAERLAGTGPDRDWTELIDMLKNLAANERRSLVQSALERGTAELVKQLLGEINTVQTTLSRPLDESQRRLEDIQIATGKSAHAWLRLGQRMTAARNSLLAATSARQQAFLAAAMSAAADEIHGAIANAPARTGPSLRRFAMRVAHAVVRREIERWHVAETAIVEAEFARTAADMVCTAADFLTGLASKHPELGYLAVTRDEPGIRYYIGDSVCLEPAGLAWRARIAELFRLPGAAHRTAEVRAMRYVENRLRAVLQDEIRTLEASANAQRERLSTSAHEKLENAYAAAERALALTRSAYAAGEETVALEQAKLDRWRNEIIACTSARRPGVDP